MSKRKVQNIFLAALIFLLLFSMAVNADMGRIKTTAADVREDFQKAIIIHDFREEILILGTDLEADENTSILRFIPLPSEPSVALADGDPFERVLELIKKHKLSFVSASKSMTEMSSSASIEVLLDTKLGAHDVTTIKIDEITDFKSWVKLFLQGKGLSPEGNYEKVVEVAADYVSRGIKYFVFDLVELTPELTSIKPLVYRFKSDKLYYPLKTSNTFGGTGGISLVIIAPGTVIDPISNKSINIKEDGSYSVNPALDPLTQVSLSMVQSSTSAEISGEELDSIYSGSQDLFANKPTFLQVINYHGKYDFADDILADISGITKKAVDYYGIDDFNTDYSEELRQFVEVILWEEDAAKANNNFAFDMFNKIMSEEQDKNIFLSPFSITTALTMTYAGAEGNTAREIADTLHYNNSGEVIHQAFSSLTDNIVNNKSQDYQLNVANALWGQKDTAFKREFLDLIEKYYAGGLKEVDFAGDNENARIQINKWVKENTGKMIKELLKQGDIDSTTRLVLTNAIYFKGDWSVQFEKKLTQKSPFILENGDNVEVQMMSRKGKYLYGEPDKEIKIIELPYKGEELSMIIVLPKEGLNKIENINPEIIDGWISNLEEREIHVFLPKFNFASRYELSGLLQSLGIHDAFSGEADFSGITGYRDLSISDVIHQANIDVSEEGTQAAAATAVVMTKMMPEIFNFRADHPFLFLIRHRPTNTILFMGLLRNPDLLK